MTFISEGDIYRLIAHSKLPGAEKFEKWVFDEVLPTIRKTGGYVNNEDVFVQTYFAEADEATKHFVKTSLEAFKMLNAKIEEDKPKVLFADAVATSKTTILVGDLAKLLNQNGINIGAKRLFSWLRENGYLIKRRGTDWNMPTQRSMDAELFEVRITTRENNDGTVRIMKTTKVTAKGQQYFINLFLKNRDQAV